MAETSFYLEYFKKQNCEAVDLELAPDPELELIVVIPAYKELNIEKAVLALLKTRLHSRQYEIIVLINHPEDADEEVKSLSAKAAKDLASINTRYPDLCLFTITKELPKKAAGVGLARKIAMDTAALRFAQLEKPQGLIVNYDADCTCTKGHLDQILSYYKRHPEKSAASIYYEHPYEAVEESQHQQYIIVYELHLRSYIQWKRWVGLPYAFHTVGSAMSCRAGIYTRKGGMNKRKAGEDFYFIHKFSQEAFGEINCTKVIPSCRVSDRVPFGTGRAMLQHLSDHSAILTYNPDSFKAFNLLIQQLDAVYEGADFDLSFDEWLKNFFEIQDLENKLEEIRTNTRTITSFKKRFFQWIDAFMFMKYLHYMRDHSYANVSVLAAANVLLKELGEEASESERSALDALRKLDRSNVGLT